MSKKSDALAAVTAEAEGAVALDVFYGEDSLQSRVGRRDAGNAVTNARNAGATDDEIRQAARQAFRKG
ncbi:hypothetical protein OG900_33170 [Streptomyces sp. NBC_00433]